MNILLLRHGAIGSVLSKLLLKDSRVKKLICADMCFKTDQKFHGLHQVPLNLKDKSQLAHLLKTHKPNLVINATAPQFNSVILAECAHAAVNYMDMAAIWDPDPNKKAVSPYKIEQFDFDKQFRAHNILGFIEGGVSPGLTNLMVRECADQFDTLDTVKIYLVDHSGTDEFHAAWSKEALLDEIASKPLIYTNGKFKIVEPFSGLEEYTFPAPYGKKKVRYICQDEIGTIPFFIKLKNLEIKDYDDQVDIHKFLYELGLVSKQKISYGDLKISPFEFVNHVLPNVAFNTTDPRFKDAQFAFAIEAYGRLAGKKQTITYYVSFPTQKELNNLGLDANFISYPTALCAKIFALAIPQVNLKGILPPEALDSKIRKQILTELVKTGHVRITKKIRQT